MPYLVTIYYKNESTGITFEAMGSAYTEYCVITSKTKAIKIDEDKSKYFVQISERFNSNEYDIEDVFYVKPLETLDTVIATHYGLLRVSY